MPLHHCPWRTTTPSDVALQCPIRLPVMTAARVKMKRLYLPTAAALAAALMLAVGPAAQAQSVADFYRGKTITYNLAVPDGASWGLYARTFIEHLRKHIPGEPLVILQVMPGGGGVAAGNHIFNVAAKDGTVIGTPLSTAMVFAATDPGQVMYDPRKFSWIGSMAVVQDVITVWHTAPARTLDEARRIELIMERPARAPTRSRTLRLPTICWGRSSGRCAAIRAAPRSTSRSSAA